MTEPRALAFLRQLWVLDQALHVASKRMAARIGVTGPQRLVIRLLGRHPAITPGELARRMHLHPSTVTDLLDRLERDGLLERRLDPDDRRQARIVLTAAGRRVDARTTGTIEAAVERALASASPADVAATGRVHAALAAALRRIPAETRSKRSRAAR